jgi:hypothetical protein
MDYRKIHKWTFALVALVLLFVALALWVALAYGDTDGPPARMVRLGPDGTAHVGTIVGMSARVGYRGYGVGRVLRTFRCREWRGGPLTWCSGRMVGGRMRVLVVYESVNQDLISYYTGNLRVFIWEP